MRKVLVFSEDGKKIETIYYQPQLVNDEYKKNLVEVLLEEQPTHEDGYYYELFFKNENEVEWIKKIIE